MIKLLPEILAAIQAIEQVAPVAKTGPAKLGLLTAVLSSIYELDSQASSVLPKDKFLGLIQTIAGQAVTFLNLVGIFHKSV